MKLLGALKLSHQVLFLLLSVPVFLVASLLYYSASQHVIIQNKPLEQLALSTSSTVAEKIDRNLNERYSDVQAFAFHPLAAEVLQKKQPDSLLENYMNKMMTYYKYYDLMMLCDLSGKVVLLNTKDKEKNQLPTNALKGKDINEQEWFRSSIVVGGPKGGAYFSDFNTDDQVSSILQNNGFGIDFSAPVRNSEGQIIGVWRNRVSWKAVTQEIRSESETALQKTTPGSFILLMDKQGHLIDADKENNIMKVTIGKNNLMKAFDFDYADIRINEEDYLYGWSESTGLHEYKGNKWKFLTLIPKVKFTDSDIYLKSDWTKLMLFSLSVLLAGATLSLLFVRRFSKRIKHIKQSVQKLSKGESEIIESISYLDEIGEMSVSINLLNANFNKMTVFANEIGEGNLSTSFSPAGDKDILGLSLLKMKKNLEHSQQEVIRQKWVSDTLTAFGELLREQQEPGIIYQKAISFLSKSIHAYQGALFFIHYDQVLPVIELKAGFALSEKRLNKEPLLLGESHVGQCIKDKEVIRLRDLPENYSEKINSGLGEFSPAEVLLIPILFNNESLGALEFSFFKTPESTSIQFLQKSSEYLGSYFAQIRFQKENFSQQRKKVENY